MIISAKVFIISLVDVRPSGTQKTNHGDQVIVHSYSDEMIKKIEVTPNSGMSIVEYTRFSVIWFLQHIEH